MVEGKIVLAALVIIGAVLLLPSALWLGYLWRNGQLGTHRQSRVAALGFLVGGVVLIGIGACGLSVGP